MFELYINLPLYIIALGDENMADNTMATKNMAEFLKNRHILHCQKVKYWLLKIMAAINMAEFLKIRPILAAIFVSPFT